MDRHQLATFAAVGVSLFASMTGAAIAIGAAMWSARRAKVGQRAGGPQWTQWPRRQHRPGGLGWQNPNRRY